ncbi:hypothetical protein [Pleomorphochaeta sp. DL1XJH-081]|jgi:hypothetical protein|uniref:hypothetical protein n=1 Tax=Pleomorphochaeta sp. DL1XJH-081 TaxID=3409690 RepID=UPI003BB70FE8
MKRIGLLLLLVAFTVIPVMAEELETGMEDPFVAELAYQLRERGWDEESVGMLREQARLLNWDEARMADPAMIAYALHYGTAEMESPSMEMARIRAEMALEIAIESREMTRLGYSKQEIAQGVAKGLHDVVEQTKAQNGVSKGERYDPLDSEVVRSAVRSAVGKEIAAQQKTTTRNAVGLTKRNAKAEGNPGASGSAFSHKFATPGGVR